MLNDLQKEQIKLLREIVKHLNTEPDRLKEYEKELVELHIKSYDNYDKKLTYVAASAIGLSFIFVERFADGDIPCSYLYLLVTAWVFLTLCLCLNIFSHIFTAKRHNQTLEEIRSNQYDPYKARIRNTEIDKYNKWVNWTFITGIGLLVLFVSLKTINMKTELKVKSKVEILSTDSISINVNKFHNPPVLTTTTPKGTPTTNPPSPLRKIERGTPSTPPPTPKPINPPKAPKK